MDALSVTPAQLHRRLIAVRTMIAALLAIAVLLPMGSLFVGEAEAVRL